MQTNIISSIDNKKIKKLLSVKNDSEFRKNEKLCFLEGEKLIFDTPKNLISEIYIKYGYKNDYYNYVRQVIEHPDAVALSFM